MRRIRFYHRIRFRLLLVALTLLGIPWLGYLFIVESEAFLRDAQKQSLQATASSVANLILSEGSALHGVARPNAVLTFRNLFLHELERPPQIDGYRDEWPRLEDNFTTLESANGEFALRVFAGHHDGLIYLLVGVADRTTQYGRNGDAIDLALVTQGGVSNLLRIRPAGPGWVTARPLETNEAQPETIALASSLRGEWQNADGGYTVELRLPTSGLADRLSLRYFDAATQRYVASSPLAPMTEIGRLVRPATDLSQRLNAITPASTRIWVTDHQGYVLARSGTLDVDAPKSPGEARVPWFVRDVVRWVLGRDADLTAELDGERSQLFVPPVVDALGGKPATLRRARPWGDAIVVAAAAPIRDSAGVRGAVLVEQTTNAVLSIQDLALQRLFAAAMLLFAVTSLGLLAFVSVLATRISRLNHDLEAAVSADGRIVAELESSQARDEIGEITRTLSGVLHRLVQRHQRLEGAALQIEAQIEAALGRLRAATASDAVPCTKATTREFDALDRLLAELREVSEVDQRLHAEGTEYFDLSDLIRQRIEAHRAQWPDSRIDLIGTDTLLSVEGVPGLLATALDALLRQLAVGKEDLTFPLEIDLQDGNGWARISIGRVDQQPVRLLNDRLPRLACTFHGGTLELEDTNGGVSAVVINLPRSGPPD